MSLFIIILSSVILLSSLLNIYNKALNSSIEDHNIFEITYIISMVLLSFFLLVFGILCNSHHIDDVIELTDHIDHSKTKTIEENGEVTDLYLTIDGKEYHFEFEEVEDE
mgnify:CR=1 FL=1